MKFDLKESQGSYTEQEVAELLTWLEGLTLADLFWLKKTYAKILLIVAQQENHRACGKADH